MGRRLNKKLIRLFFVFLTASILFILPIIFIGCSNPLQDIAKGIVSSEINIKYETEDIPSGSECDFGKVLLGLTKSTNFTIENLGTADLILFGDSPFIEITGKNAYEFYVERPPESPIAPGSSTTFVIKFNPSNGGSKTATIIIKNYDADENPYEINITGQCTTIAEPEINVRQGTTDIPTSGSYDFGSVAVGSSSTVVTFIIENLGTADLNLNGTPKVEKTGINASEFNVEIQPSSPIPPSNSTQFTIAPNPVSTGTKSATLSIPNDDSDKNPYAFTITAEGVIIPTVYINSPLSSPINTSPIPITITLSEEVTGFDISDITVGNGTASNLQTADNTVFTAYITPSGDGTVIVDIAAGVAQSIASGRNNEAASQFSIIYDTTPPIATLSNLPSNPTTNQSVDITVGGTGVISYQYKLDSGLWSSERDISIPITASSLSLGSHTVCAIAKDEAGNWQLEANSTDYTWEIKDGPPPPTVTVAPSSPTNNNAPTWSWTAVTDTTEYRHNFTDGPSWTDHTNLSNLSYTPSSPLVDGNHTLYVQAYDDSLELWSASGSASITIDTTPPTANLTNLPSDPTGIRSIDITVGGTGVISYQYKLDSGLWSSERDISIPITASSLSLGSHTVCAIAKDEAGNWQLEANSTDYTWEIVNNPPTIDSYSPTNLTPSVYEGSSITFSITASDPDEDMLSYQWKIDGVNKSAADSYIYSPVSADAGSHTVSVTVSDGKGGDDSKSWNVTVIGITGLYITGSSQINEYSSVSYIATLSYSDGSNQTVTPAWSENSSYASVSSIGVVAASNVPSNQSFTLTASYSGFTAAKTITIIDEVISAPNTPYGPSEFDTGTYGIFNTGGSSSNLGHSVQYRFYWGDGTYSNWSSSASANHPWSTRGTYYVRAQARCATHTSEVSAWSPSVAVTIYETGTWYNEVYVAVPIPDGGGFTNTASVAVDITGSPSGSVIRYVEVWYDIYHTYVGDLIVWLTTYESGWIDSNYLWNMEGGSADNIINDHHQIFGTWTGLTANRTFYLVASDHAGADVGQISRVKVLVHWKRY